MDVYMGDDTGIDKVITINSLPDLVIYMFNTSGGT